MDTDENYMNLFAEIYRIAVKDDIAMVSKKNNRQINAARN